MDEDRLAAWTMLTTRVLAPNAGPMTLGGTNSFIVRRPDSHRVVVVDPGPLDAIHLRRLASQGLIELILLTHFHEDHAEAAHRLSIMTDAPVRAMDASHCVQGTPLEDGEEIRAGGTRLRVIATPGTRATRSASILRMTATLRSPRPVVPCSPATQFSAAVRQRSDRRMGHSADISARSIGCPHSVRRSCCLGTALAWRVSPSPRGRNVAHRRRRLRDVSSAMNRLDSRAAGAVTVASITDLVYPDVVVPEVRLAAEATVRAQLDYLAESADQPDQDSVL